VKFQCFHAQNVPCFWFHDGFQVIFRRNLSSIILRGSLGKLLQFWQTSVNFIPNFTRRQVIAYSNYTLLKEYHMNVRRYEIHPFTLSLHALARIYKIFQQHSRMFPHVSVSSVYSDKLNWVWLIDFNFNT
jgi:hypothetical protein